MSNHFFGQRRGGRDAKSETILLGVAIVGSILGYALLARTTRRVPLPGPSSIRPDVETPIQPPRRLGVPGKHPPAMSGSQSLSQPCVFHIGHGSAAGCDHLNQRVPHPYRTAVG